MRRKAIEMTYRHTKCQVPRGARADAETQDRLFLLKNVSCLRLTYQIRLLAFRATETGRRLIIQVPKQCQIHSSLRDFNHEFEQTVRVEKV
jgi:hypothetical protein